MDARLDVILVARSFPEHFGWSLELEPLKVSIECQGPAR